MFKKFCLKNYRTHIDTTLELKDVTLILGANNSGKSNLLSGLSYFSRLVSAASPSSEKSKRLKGSHYFPHKHSLSGQDVPISFGCEWEREGKRIAYEMQLYCLSENDNNIGCKEKIVITNDTETTITYGHDEPSQEMLLRTKLESEDLTPDKKELTDIFFRALELIYCYHFQPTFLKGQAVPIIHGNPQEQKDFSETFTRTGKTPNIASAIGREGTNFQALIKYVKEHDEVAYGRFLRYLKRFVKSFNGIVIDNGVAKWQFDMGNSNCPHFDVDKISEGLIKAGAIALLCAMETPPAILMVEEIENGINQRNISEFLSWLFEISEKGRNTQFILTSHSPSVIRQFSKRLDAVYNLHFRPRDYRTLVTNLNDAIKPLVDMELLPKYIIERDGKEVMEIKPYRLTKLFYDGVLGSL
jgi:AAA15 family ATPase/GTPase